MITRIISNRRHMLVALLCLILSTALTGQSQADNRRVTHDDGPLIAPEVSQTVAVAGAARVVITLDIAPVALADLEVQELVAAQQDALLAHMPSGALTVIRRYEALPALAGLLTDEGLRALAGDPAVRRVQLDEPSSGHLGESVPALQADVVHRDYGLTGAGKRVAVLDTGIDTDHPDLAGAVVAQRCFTDGDCAPHRSDSGDSAEDEHGHGTNVGGIITADGFVSSRGFAPEAELVAIRVLNGSNWGWLSDWVAGLDWILANQSWLHVDAVNMSLGTVALYPGNCDATWPIVTYAVQRLAQIGVPVFASSGNQGDGLRMGSPACNRDVIAVGATYDGDLGRQPSNGTYKSRFGGDWPDCYDVATHLGAITCFTNGGEMLDLLAPGMWISSTGIGGGRSTYAGTSQAAPTVASIAILMLQANEQLTPAELETILQLSGAQITDLRNGRTLSTVNALAAIEALDLAALEPVSWLPMVAKGGQAGHGPHDAE